MSVPHGGAARAAPRGRRLLAALLLGVGAALGVGGALEFRYFGPRAVQFWAGVVAVPAGAYAVAAAVRLWRRGAGARDAVRHAALGLLAATAVGAALRVMGPPAILLGLVGSGAALGWAWRQRRVAG
jgi:hypothetical protein